MTTVITDTDPLTPAPSSFTFEYKDHAGDAVRVNVVGDVTAEFIFARMTKGDDKGGGVWNDVILGEPVGAGSKEDGRDLFHVYVAQASIDSFISVAKGPAGHHDRARARCSRSTATSRSRCFRTSASM
jgi:hypothetical protein